MLELSLQSSLPRSLCLNVEAIVKRKTSVCFTWDDNLSRQITAIAPLFMDYEMRCTFYVVPGNAEYTQEFASGYKKLCQKGFEIGNHSLNHQHMTQLSKTEALNEIDTSLELLTRKVGSRPTTFAFPHHDFNEHLVQLVKNSHLETRNTLNGATRFSLKTATTFDSVDEAIKLAIEQRTNIVFSGHSIITDEEIAKGKCGEGYEPVRISLLKQVLELLQDCSSVDVLTFERAALDTFILEEGRLEGTEVLLGKTALDRLNDAGITVERLEAFYG